MATITVDVSEALAKLDPRDMEKAIKSSLGDVGSEVQFEAQRYPAAPKPTYDWTYTLKRGWTSKVKGWQAIIGNTTKYAPYVQDADEQAWMHRGRWQTTADIARKKAKDVVRIIETALARWAR